jgi:hypothetical protein
MSLSDCIDLTGKGSVARKAHDGMTDSNKRDAEDKIASTLQTKINKEVKSTLLDVAHREKLRQLNCEHLTRNVVPATQMVHHLKPTMDKLFGTHQQDNAGPHIEEGYRLWTQHIFDNLGWLYEPQAPQGIHNA